MRVLVISNLYPPDFIGGYELACGQAVDALRCRGHEVQVLTTAPRVPVPFVPFVRRTLQLTDVYTSYCVERNAAVTQRLNHAEANYVNAYNVHSLMTTLKEFQPEVVYLWSINSLGGLGLLGYLEYVRMPWVWHLMDGVPRDLCGRGNALVPALAREFERQFQGDYLVCSERLLKAMEETGLRLRGTVELLPNWIRGQRPPARRSDYAGGHLRIMSAGQIGRHKGVDLLIQSAAQLREGGIADFSVDIYGKVTDAFFPRLVQELRLQEIVNLKGPRTQAELWDLYGQYDVFAFPTWEQEPFAFAPLEAAAHGCVPIMSRVCGNAEWFVHDVHCLKAERTAEGFSQVFHDIVSGKINLEPLSRRTSAVVWRDFHLESVLPRIELALQRAARRSRYVPGSTGAAYRMALLAEKLIKVMIQEPFCA